MRLQEYNESWKSLKVTKQTLAFNLRSFKYVICSGLTPFHKEIMVAALKTAQIRTPKNTLDTWGNYQQYTHTHKKNQNSFKFQHLILYSCSLKKNSTDCKICGQRCSCSPLSLGAVGSFCNGTFVVFSPTAELNRRVLVLVYWSIRVLL